MKKYVILSILTMAMTTAFAQMDWGVKLGGGSASLGDGANGFDVSFGVTSRAELLDRFGIQFDALYSIKNAFKTEKDEMTDKNITTSYDFRYIELPFQVYFPFSEHLHLLVGLNFAAVSSAKYKVSRQDAEDDKEWSDIEGADAGIGFVGGLKYETATGWDVNLRYLSASGNPVAGQANTIQISVAKFINW
jgi:hypothetical protein